MPNVQQPEMRRTETTSLTQGDTSSGGGRGRPSGGKGKEHRTVPKDQQSPYGPQEGEVAADADES